MSTDIFLRSLKSIMASGGGLGYKGIVFFGVGSFGLPSGGTAHGYAFSPSGRVDRVVEKIEPHTLNEIGIVYQKIADGWYLFFSVEG
ncbi:MAG TPA: hypothetical protein PLN52_21340 [Opitutaceae bacterium]|nr:hypothetical protein [Opitutaceae bacterium]